VRQAVQFVSLWTVIYTAIHLPPLLPGKRADLSYGIYLCHFPIIQLLINWKDWSDGMHFILLPAILVLALAFAKLSWNLVEQPAMAFGKRLVAHEARN